MLLAKSCVREAAKTARVCRIRHAPLAASLYSLFIQKHCAKSGTFGFFKTNSEIVGIALLRSNGRKGRQPLQWKWHCRPLQWKRHRRPPSLFIQNGFAGLVALGGRGARLPQRGQAPWRLAKPMRLPPKFPHMEFCIYPNKMPTHLSFPKALFYSLAALRIK